MVIDPAEVPQILGDIEALAEHARALQDAGEGFGDTGSDVNTAWQGLAPVYETPEFDLLLAATGPVASAARDVGDDLAAVGDALATYAATVAPIKTRLEGLRDTAAALVSSLPSCDPDDWRDDFDRVNEHNNLLTSINFEVEAWMTAQRTCANTINALYGGTQWTAADAEGAADGSAFGFSAHTLDAVAGEQGLPWGGYIDHDRGFWPHVVEGVWGFVVDGVWGDIDGMGDLIGLGGWETSKESWVALDRLGANLVGLSGWEAFKDSWTDMGKGLLAWDEWGDNNGRATGQVAYNATTLLVPGLGLLRVGRTNQATRPAAGPPTTTPSRITTTPHAPGDGWSVSVPPPITDGPALPTKPMSDSFRYETVPGHPDNPFGLTRIARLTDEGREQFRVFVAPNGLLYRTDGNLFDTRQGDLPREEPAPAIFIMDEYGNLYATRVNSSGTVQHSTLANGQPVAGAGELIVENGRLVYLNDNSPQYLPTRAMSARVALTLESQYVNMDDVLIRLSAPGGEW